MPRFAALAAASAGVAPPAPPSLTPDAASGLAAGALLRGRRGAVLDSFNAAGAVVLGRRNALVEASAACAAEGDRPRLHDAAVDILAREAPGAEAAMLTGGGGQALDAALAVVRAASGRPRVVRLDADATPLAAALARGDVAAVLADPLSLDVDRAHQTLAEARRLCDRHGALLVVDERLSAPRLGPGGAQALWRVDADLAVYGPALANGYALGGLTGRAGLVAVARTVRTMAAAPSPAALAAMVTTSLVLRHAPVRAVLQVRGSELQAELAAALASSGADRFARIAGDPTAVRLEFGHPALAPVALRRFVQRELWRDGVLMRGRIHVSFAWADAEVSRMVNACRLAFAAVARSVATWERCRAAA